MWRTLTALVVTIAALGCVDEGNPPPCEGQADFVVTLRAHAGELPTHTLIEVTFGGGNKESYSPGFPSEPEVLFCETRSDPAGAAGGASHTMAGAPWAIGGSADSEGGAGGTSAGHATTAIRSIVCEVWSGGPATILVRANGLVTTQDLEPDPELCSLNESIVLGGPPKP